MQESRRGSTLEDVASACGFCAPATLRHPFRDKLKTTPAAYRKRLTLMTG